MLLAGETEECPGRCPGLTLAYGLQAGGFPWTFREPLAPDRERSVVVLEHPARRIVEIVELPSAHGQEEEDHEDASQGDGHRDEPDQSVHAASLPGSPTDALAGSSAASRPPRLSRPR